MIQLKLVKSQEEENLLLSSAMDANGVLHGTKYCKFLVCPWSHSKRGVCADSYFAAVSTVEEMNKMGLRFIEDIKTATQKYPMTWLSSFELENCGDWKGLVSKDKNGKPNMLAFVWMDQTRHYFILF